MATRRRIIQNNDSVNLYMINPIYKSKTKIIEVEGVKTKVEESVLVKEVYSTKWIKKDAITSVDDYITDKNTISKTKSLIFDKYSCKFFVTAHRAADIIEAISGSNVRSLGIGFNQNNNNYATGISGKKSRL